MEVERQKKEEVKRLKQLEKEKLEQLIDNAEKWSQTEKTLNYLTTRKQTLIENNLFTNEEKEYYEWGLKAIENIKSDLLTSKN